MLNVVVLMGRLVSEPELRTTTSGISTCTFRIAVDRNFVKQGEERKADFIDIVTWRQQAEFVCKYFHKGSMIAVNGSLQTRTYDDKNGNKRYVVEVIADGVSFTGEKAGANAGSSAPVPAARPMQAAPVSFSAGEPDDFAPITEDDDLPF